MTPHAEFKHDKFFGLDSWFDGQFRVVKRYGANGRPATFEVWRALNDCREHFMGKSTTLSGAFAVAEASKRAIESVSVGERSEKDAKGK